MWGVLGTPARLAALIPGHFPPFLSLTPGPPPFSAMNSTPPFPSNQDGRGGGEGRNDTRNDQQSRHSLADCNSVIGRSRVTSPENQCLEKGRAKRTEGVSHDHESAAESQNRA